MYCWVAHVVGIGWCCCGPHPYMLWNCLHELAVVNHTFIVRPRVMMCIPHPFAFSSRYACTGCWRPYIYCWACTSGRPRVVLKCSTPMYAFKSVCLDWLLLTTPLISCLPCSCSRVITMHSYDAFIHIRISYDPGGMFRLDSSPCSYCELALPPVVVILCICTFYFVSGTLVRHNHASDCFMVWPPVVILYFLPLCCISTMFCSLCWASPTEGVFVRFIAFAVTCSNSEPHPEPNFATTCMHNSNNAISCQD